MAAIEGGMKCIKYLLFAFNLIFAVSDLRLNTYMNTQTQLQKNWDVLIQVSSMLTLLAKVGIAFSESDFACKTLLLSFVHFFLFKIYQPFFIAIHKKVNVGHI